MEKEACPIQTSAQSVSGRDGDRRTRRPRCAASSEARPARPPARSLLHRHCPRPAPAQTQSRACPSAPRARKELQLGGSHTGRGATPSMSRALGDRQLQPSQCHRGWLPLGTACCAPRFTLPLFTHLASRGGVDSRSGRAAPHARPGDAHSHPCGEGKADPYGNVGTCCPLRARMVTAAPVTYWDSVLRRPSAVLLLSTMWRCCSKCHFTGVLAWWGLGDRVKDKVGEGSGSRRERLRKEVEGSSCQMGLPWHPKSDPQV